MRDRRRGREERRIKDIESKGGKSGGEGGKKKWKTKGMREGRKEIGGKGRERGAIRDTEGVVETWRDLNNTLHLNASTDKRNGPATRNILLRAIIFSLANAPVAIVSLSRISCNSLSLSPREMRTTILFVSNDFFETNFLPPSSLLFSLSFCF